MSESPVIQFINKMADLILLNALWLISCIPIITAGAATTAMYSVLIRSIRYGDGYVTHYYWKAFKSNFIQSTIVWICMILTTGFFAFDLYFWGTLMSGFYAKIMLYVSTIFAFFAVLIFLYIFPTIAKFQGTLKLHLKNSALMAIGHFQYSAIIIIIIAMFFYANYISTAANFIMLFIGFSLLAYLLSFFYYRVFMFHMNERYDDFDRERDNADKIN